MKYKITISDKFDNRIYTGVFKANSELEAITDCQDFYAQELDSIPDNIQILDIIKLGGGKK